MKRHSSVRPASERADKSILHASDRVRDIVRSTRSLVLPVLLTLGSAFPTTVRSEEPVMTFLEALREQGYYDEALDYLDEMRSSPVAPASFGERYDFERGRTLLMSLRRVREKTRQEAILDGAEQALEKFVTERRTHADAAEATELLAGLMLRRSEFALEKSKQENVAEGQRAALLEQARRQLAKAQEVYVRVQEDLKRNLQRIDPKTTDPQQRSFLEDYRVRYMQVKLALPQIKLSEAATYAEAEPQRAALLAAAETEYGAVRKDYRNFGGTYLLATVGMAQAMQLQGKQDEALLVLEEMFALPNSPELRDVKRRALVVALAAYRTKQPIPYGDMIDRAEPIVGQLLPVESEDPDYLTLQLELAGLYHDAAAELTAKPDRTAEDRTKIELFENRAEEIVREMTRSNGPLKEAAQQLLATWGRGRAVVTSDVAEPANFIQARDRGVAVLTDFDNARVALETLRAQLPTTTDPAAKADLESKIALSEQVLRTSPIEAMRWFERALTLADNETPPEDLAIVRRYMAYLHFVEGRPYQAATIGEFQLVTDPTGAGSRASGSIALNAYWTLYQQAPEQDRTFEIEHLRNVADRLIDGFPETDEAIRAANLMAFVSLAAGDLEAARSYLAAIPETAPERTRTRLMIGTRIFGDYLRELSRIGADRRAGTIDPAEATRQEQAIVARRGEARAELEAGVPQLAAADMDASMINATLALAQIALMENRPADAVALLERPGAGLLELIKAKHPEAIEPERAGNIYRTALRAYIGSLASASDKAAQLQKARSVMSALSESAGTTPEGQARLVALYVALVGDLRLQMEAMPDKTQRLAFGNGTASFLEEAARGATDGNLLIWTSETMASVAETLAADGHATEAERLYQKAEEGLAKVLASKPSDDLARRVRIQQAGILRARGRYEEAVKAYADLLAPNPSLVSVQVDAAMAYHLWGRATRSSERLAAAMSGGEPRENPRTKRTENAIWGWGKLAQTTARSPQFRETFLQARYQLAYARFEYAVLNDSAEQLARVKRDIQGTMQVDEALGGGAWAAKFDALAKALQKQLGEPQQGISALR